MRRSALLPLALAVPALVLAGCGSSGSSTSATTATTGTGGGTSSVLVGAGSTLVAPLMSKWSSDYSKKANVTVTYGSIGSGGGISQITARTVDFGASDAPLTPDQAKAANGVVQIPWALAATVVVYNLRGAPNGLKLTGSVVADIYQGKVTHWNDPAIAKLNPGVTLPATKITPVYRSDSSGDTYAFTSYLAKVSPSWKSAVGASTQVSFPKGLGSKGNDGVSATLSRLNGGIGYVAISYVAPNHLDYARIQNAAGKYPTPGIASITAAAKAVTTIPSDNAISLVDPPASAPGAYPISTYTYALVPMKSGKATTMRDFLTYAVTAGQAFGPPLEFAPLPSHVVAADKKTIATITT
jgi:phosphate transport system substrate-binding protein